MVLRMPIPREKYMLVSRFIGFLSAQFLDDGEDFLVVGYREGASCAEVILHVDHYQSSDFLFAEFCAGLDLEGSGSEYDSHGGYHFSGKHFLFFLLINKL